MTFDRVIVRARFARLLGLLLAVLTLFLASCAPVVNDGDAGSTADALNGVQGGAADGMDAELPNVELTGQLLNDLLTVELSYYRNLGNLTIDKLYRIAEQTKDPRIAEIATIRAVGLKRPDVAQKAAALWVEIAPLSDRAWLNRHLIHIETRQFDDAVESFAHVIQLSSDGGALAASQSARMLSSTLEPKTAFEIYSQFVENIPANSIVSLQLIHLAIFAQLNSSLIDQMLTDLLAAEPDYDDAATAKFRYLLESERAEAADSFAAEFLQENEDALELREQYAHYLADAGFYFEAVVQYQLLARPESAFFLGTLHERANKLQLALDSYIAYLEQKPADQRVYSNLARINLELEQYDEALEWIKGITEGSLEFERVLLYSKYIAATEDLDSAEKYLRGYRPRTDNEQIRVYLVLDNIFQQDLKFEKSMDLLDEALEIFPGNSTLLLSRSYISAELKRIDLVERDINVLLAKQPDNPDALNTLGYTLADQTDRLDEALDLVQQAHELRPHDPYILDSMGWVHYKLGNFDLAIDFLTTALERRDDPIIAAHLGEVYWVAGKRSQARRVWAHAQSLDPDHKILLDTIQKLTKQ